MGSIVVSSCVLVFLNVLYLCGGAALAAIGILYYCELNEWTTLRDPNAHLLELSWTWSEVAPWVFACSGILALLVACCGFATVGRRSRTLLYMYSMFLVISAILLAAGGGACLSYAVGSAQTDQWIRKTVTEVFDYRTSNTASRAGFAAFEERYRCCGSLGAADYRSRNERVPPSCCAAEEGGCGYESRPNLRRGCGEVASFYSNRALLGLSAGGVALAVIAILTLVPALTLVYGLSRRRRLAYDQNSEATTLHGGDTLKITH